MPSHPTISLIAALSENRTIGRAGGLPWHLPDDLRHFKRLTLGHPVVMGRRTFEEVGRPLPGRRNIVVTRQADWRREGVETAGSLRAALDRVAAVDEVWIIGGAQIYAAALEADVVDRMELTRIHAIVDGDVFFPEHDPRRWTRVASATHPSDERHAYAFTFESYVRVRAALSAPTGD